MQNVLKIIFKFIIICILTVLTQIGGIIYLIIEVCIKRNNTRYKIKKFGVFIISYSIITFLIIPYLAPVWGREKLQENEYITSHTFFTTLCNRNYVTPQLSSTLQRIARDFQKQHDGIKITYLDANFPFLTGFPLFPHLSHNDGKKIDISFIYEDQSHNITDKKPSISGYGVFEAPTQKEYDQTEACGKKGYWQYDFTKYVTLGTINTSIKFSEKATKDLLLTIISPQEVSKVFIEPHLRSRLHINSPKIRFHGCRAVRHDDHIHVQIK